MMGFTEATKYPSAIIICGSLDRTCLENVGHDVCATFCSLALIDLMHRYNIEPFFFTSSINRIPSRYQEAFSHGKGDRQSDRKSNIYILDPRLTCTTRHYYYPAIHTNSAGARATIIHYSNTIPLDSDR